MGNVAGYILGGVVVPQLSVVSFLGFLGAAC